MKTGIHPENYRLVVFKDLSINYSFLTKSCVESKETVKWEDGNEYPIVKLEISHMSHPFYTGKVKWKILINFIRRSLSKKLLRDLLF